MRLLTDEDMRWVAGGDPNSQGYEGQMYEDSSGTWIFEGGSWQPYDIGVTGPSSPPPPPPYFPSGGGGGGQGGGEGSEIVIVANTANRKSSISQAFIFHGETTIPSGGTWFDPFSYNPPDCRETQVEYDHLATMNKANTDQATKLSNAIESHSDRMRGMPNEVTVMDPSGHVFTTGAELKDLWSRTDFVVTGVIPGEGRGGATRGGPGNPTLEVNSTALDGYLFDSPRQAWYFFHETAHATASGRAMNEAAYRGWEADKQGKTYEKSDYFINNEQAMNTVAANLGAQYGVDIRNGYSNVPHGYGTGYEVRGTPGFIQPDVNGSGPGGTC